MGERGRRGPGIPRHHAERDYSAVAASARHIEVVVTHRADLGGQSKGAVVRRFGHTRTNPELYRHVELSLKDLASVGAH